MLYVQEKVLEMCARDELTILTCHPLSESREILSKELQSSEESLDSTFFSYLLLEGLYYH